MADKLEFGFYLLSATLISGTILYLVLRAVIKDKRPTRVRRIVGNWDEFHIGQV